MRHSKGQRVHISFGWVCKLGENIDQSLRKVPTFKFVFLGNAFDAVQASLSFSLLRWEIAMGVLIIGSIGIRRQGVDRCIDELGSRVPSLSIPFPMQRRVNPNLRRHAQQLEIILSETFQHKGKNNDKLRPTAAPRSM